MTNRPVRIRPPRRRLTPPNRQGLHPQPLCPRNCPTLAPRRPAAVKNRQGVSRLLPQHPKPARLRRAPTAPPCLVRLTPRQLPAPSQARRTSPPTPAAQPMPRELPCRRRQVRPIPTSPLPRRKLSRVSHPVHLVSLQGDSLKGLMSLPPARGARQGNAPSNLRPASRAAPSSPARGTPDVRNPGQEKPRPNPARPVTPLVTKPKKQLHPLH